MPIPLLFNCLTRQASKVFSVSVKQISGSVVPHGNVPSDKNVGSSWQGGSSTHGKGYAATKQGRQREELESFSRDISMLTTAAAVSYPLAELEVKGEMEAVPVEMAKAKEAGVMVAMAAKGVKAD